MIARIRILRGDILRTLKRSDVRVGDRHLYLLSGEPLLLSYGGNCSDEKRGELGRLGKSFMGFKLCSFGMIGRVLLFMRLLLLRLA